MKSSNLFYLFHFVLQRILMRRGGYKKRKLKERVFSFYTPSRLLLKKMHALRKLVYEITTRPDVLFLFAPQPLADPPPLRGPAHNRSYSLPNPARVIPPGWGFSRSSRTESQMHQPQIQALQQGSGHRTRSALKLRLSDNQDGR